MRANGVRERGRKGYTLVALMVAITLMMVMMAAVLPLTSTQAQRDREEELIFRGLQYAEGVRLFKKRHGRYPNSLQEMMEVRPRTIRKLWKDPMTGSASWGIITPVTPGAPIPGSQGQGKGGPRPLPTPSPVPTPSGGGGRLGNPELPQGPVIGVHSTSDKKAFRTFQGREVYSEWRFTEEALRADPKTGIANVPGMPGGGAGPGVGGAPGPGLGSPGIPPGGGSTPPKR